MSSTYYAIAREDAERFFPPQDREKAAQDLEPFIRNKKQQLYRAEKKAAKALAFWCAGLGTLWDLGAYALESDAADDIARDIVRLKRRQEQYRRPFITDTVSREEAPEIKGSEQRRAAP